MLQTHIRLNLCEYKVCTVFILEKTVIFICNIYYKLYNNLLNKYKKKYYINYFNILIIILIINILNINM